ncbi:MAG TPA: SRPBCC family protein [Terriglobales bacterium]|nr:SRPBCC family protein [Terriglobales bacterium]
MTLLGGAAVGAGLMYLLDPDRGNRRRALLRDKAVRAEHVSACAVDKAVRDLRNRALGVVAATVRALRRGSVPDEKLLQRVRSTLGRCSSHPHAIKAEVRHAVVTLSGPVLAEEVDCVLNGAWSVRGVRSVENALEVHEQPGDVASLQGGGRPRSGQRLDIFQEKWAPGTRLLVGAGGALALAVPLRRPAVPARLAGAALLARAITNFPLRRLARGELPGVVVQKCISIHAPLEQVFQLWANPENFPKFMAHLVEVKRHHDNRYRWVAEGPAGIPVEWEAEITEAAPNRLLAWRSLPGSEIETSGKVLFEHQNGITRAHIRMEYVPPAGVAGHALAALFGRDPKSEMDEDLARMKSLLELGKTRAHGRRVTPRQIGVA